MVNSAAATAVHREHTDLLLQPPLEQIDMLDWRAFERAIDSGYRHTLERIERLPGPLVAASGCTVLAGPDDPPQERGLDLLSDTPA